LGQKLDSTAIGIDVGGTKIAAAVVDVETGRLLERRQQPTHAERGGAAVLADCAMLARELGADSTPVGIGLCELVDLEGRPASADTVDWRELDVSAAFAAPRVTLESDVRAAARAEACFGAGQGRSAFIFTVVGTGASVCLVVDGVPHVGERGYAIVLGAPPVETIASGRALAQLSGADSAEELLADEQAVPFVAAAATALAQTLAVLANALDPAVVVLGGGLGSDPRFCARVATAFAPLVAYPSAPALELVPSRLGPDVGVVGAALCAVTAARDTR
jgi:glucokinase